MEGDANLIGNHYIDLWDSFAWASATGNDITCSLVTRTANINAILSLGQSSDATHTEAGVHIYVSGAAIIVAPILSAVNAADIYAQAVPPNLV